MAALIWVLLGSRRDRRMLLPWVLRVPASKRRKLLGMWDTHSRLSLPWSLKVRYHVPKDLGELTISWSLLHLTWALISMTWDLRRKSLALLSMKWGLRFISPAKMSGDPSRGSFRPGPK